MSAQGNAGSEHHIVEGLELPGHPFGAVVGDVRGQCQAQLSDALPDARGCRRGFDGEHGGDDAS